MIRMNEPSSLAYLFLFQPQWDSKPLCPGNCHGEAAPIEQRCYVMSKYVSFENPSVATYLPPVLGWQLYPSHPCKATFLISVLFICGNECSMKCAFTLSVQGSPLLSHSLSPSLPLLLASATSSLIWPCKNFGFHILKMHLHAETIDSGGGGDVAPMRDCAL